MELNFSTHLSCSVEILFRQLIFQQFWKGFGMGTFDLMPSSLFVINSSK
jgi:hypothetical protein